jgi:hypothetical protein
MHPHTALSLALMDEFHGERTRIRRRSPRRDVRLRAARRRSRAARAAADCA